MARFTLNRQYDQINEIPNIPCGGAVPVYHDVGMSGRYFGAANPHALHATLVDESSGTDALDFPENGAGAGLRIQWRMPLGPPSQVLTDYAAQHGRVCVGQLEGGIENDIVCVVKRRVVVPEVEPFPWNRFHGTIRPEQCGRYHDFVQKHGPLALWSGRQEV